MRYLVVALLLLAGCGGCGDDNGLTDSGGDDGDVTGDADIDSDPNVRGMVTVHLVDKLGVGVPGIDVVFIDTDTTMTQLVTDASGIAQANVYPNASVTAIHEHTSANSYSMTTVLALDPGDDIRLVTSWEQVSIAEDPFSLRTVPLPTVDIASATKPGNNDDATYTTLQPHGFAVGDTVLVETISPAGFQGTHTIASVPSPTSFTMSFSGNLGSSTTTGLATKVYPFTFNYPSYAGAQSYAVYNSCEWTDVGTSLSPQLVLKAPCTPSPMTVVVVAQGAASVPLAYMQQQVTISAGGSVTLTDTWHPAATLAASYSNPTSGVTGISTERFVPYLRPYPVAQGSGMTQSLKTPLSSMAFMKTRLRCPLGASPDCVSNSVGDVTQTITEQVDGTLDSYSLDIGANLLPWVSGIYVQSPPSIDLTVTGTGAIDLYEANIRYTGMTGTGRDLKLYTWRVFGPAAEDFTFPTLPPTLPGDPTVLPSDIQSTLQIYLCDTDAVNGYRNAIKNPYETLALCEGNATVTTKPLTATKSRLSQWN